MIADYLARLPWWRRLLLLVRRGYTRPMPIEENGQTWYTVKEATQISGLTRQRLHQYINDGRLEVRRTGRAIWISGASLATLQDRHRPTGRPKKPLTKDNI